MATGVEKAADRLQNVHNVHLLICLVVVVFAAIDVLDARHKKERLDREHAVVEPILRLAQVNVASLREELIRTYAAAADRPQLQAESARVGALIADMYRAKEYIELATKPIVRAMLQSRQEERSALLGVMTHLDRVKRVLAYGTDTKEQELVLVNPKLGTLGEPQQLTQMSIEDLARLGYAASVSPRTIVERLAPIVDSKAPMTSEGIASLVEWTKDSAVRIEDKRHLRADAIRLWQSWIGYVTNRATLPPDSSPADTQAKPGQAKGTSDGKTTEDRDEASEELRGDDLEGAVTGPVERQEVIALSTDEEALRKLKASLTSSESIENLFRQLTIERAPEIHPLLSIRSVKIPGVDIDLRFRYLFVVLPWIVAVLLVFKYATVHQIRLIADSSPAKRSEMQGEVAGAVPFYRWTGQLAWLVRSFVVVTELASILVLPALGLWFYLTKVAIAGSVWFWIGVGVAFVVWVLYILELVSARAALEQQA